MFRTIRQRFATQRKRGTLITQLTQPEVEHSSMAELMRLVEAEGAFNRQILIATLAGTTAVIHIYLGGTLFVLNGVGFLAALAAHYGVPQRESYQQWTRDGLLGYTGFTVAGYFVVNGIGGWTNPLGIATKLVELGLIRVLWADRTAAKDKPVTFMENEPREAPVYVEVASGELTAA